MLACIAHKVGEASSLCFFHEAKRGRFAYFVSDAGYAKLFSSRNATDSIDRSRLPAD